MTLLLAVFGLGYAIVAVGMVIGTWFGHLVVRPFYHVKVRELTLFESGLEIMEGRKALRDYHSRAMRG